MLKMTILLALSFSLSQTICSQTKVILKKNICGFKEPLNRDEIYTWDASNQALEYVKRICNAAFIEPNFIVKRADVDNALATIDDNNNRVIYYSASFFQSLHNETFKIAILAHEIGHHVNNHTFSKNDRRPTDELIADQFAGSILCKLHLHLEDARQLLNEQCSTQGVGYYPARSARIEAVTVGFERCKRNDGPGDDIVTEEKSKTTLKNQNILGEYQLVYTGGRFVKSLGYINVVSAGENKVNITGKFTFDTGSGPNAHKADGSTTIQYVNGYIDAKNIPIEDYDNVKSIETKGSIIYLWQEANGDESRGEHYSFPYLRFDITNRTITIPSSPSPHEDTYNPLLKCYWQK